MNMLEDRQNRYCLLFVCGFCAVLLCFSIFLGQLQNQYVIHTMLADERVIASSLLAQGISPETIAVAFSSEEVTEEGSLFLQQIGHSASISPWLLPAIRQSSTYMTIYLILLVLFLSMVLISGIFFYIKKREYLYETASDMVERFSQGDFTCHLPRNQSGTIYQLFASIDQLAMALETKSEAEHQTKEFLKDTISDISHQLKTPLAALQMYTEIIMKEPEHSDIVQNFAQKSMQSLERIETLIQSLLKIMRLDSGSILFEKIWCPIEELVKCASENLLLRAEHEKKQLVMDGPSGEMIFCDPEWTSEAISNLLKNALDHTETGSVIQISWEHSPAMFRLSVTDTGSGIAPEDIHHIFKRFYRSRRSNDRQGCGLGLPLAKGIIEGQGGILSVSSVQGEGSVFQISFLTDLTKS